MRNEYNMWDYSFPEPLGISFLLVSIDDSKEDHFYTMRTVYNKMFVGPSMAKSNNRYVVRRSNDNNWKLVFQIELDPMLNKYIPSDWFLPKT